MLVTFHYIDPSSKISFIFAETDSYSIVVINLAIDIFWLRITPTYDTFTYLPLSH